MSAFDSGELMSWEDYVEQRVKPHFDKLDAWDTTILKSVHTRFARLYIAGKVHLVIDLDLIKRDVISEIGFIAEAEFAARCKRLENLALIVRAIRLN